MKKIVLIFSIIINVFLIIILFIQEYSLTNATFAEVEKNIDELNSRALTISFIANKEAYLKEQMNLYCIYSFDGKKKKIKLGNNNILISPFKTMNTYNEKVFGTKNDLQMYINAYNSYVFSSAAYNLIYENKKKEVSIKLLELLSEYANDTVINYSEASNKLQEGDDLPSPNKITPKMFLVEFQKFLKNKKYNPIILRGPCVRYISGIHDLGYISKSEYNVKINNLFVAPWPKM